MSQNTQDSASLTRSSDDTPAVPESSSADSGPIPVAADRTARPEPVEPWGWSSYLQLAPALPDDGNTNTDDSWVTSIPAGGLLQGLPRLPGIEEVTDISDAEWQQMMTRRRRQSLPAAFVLRLPNDQTQRHTNQRAQQPSNGSSQPQAPELITPATAGIPQINSTSPSPTAQPITTHRSTSLMPPPQQTALDPDAFPNAIMSLINEIERGELVVQRRLLNSWLDEMTRRPVGALGQPGPVSLRQDRLWRNGNNPELELVRLATIVREMRRGLSMIETSAARLHHVRARAMVERDLQILREQQNRRD